MTKAINSRRDFLKTAGLAAAAALLTPTGGAQNGMAPSVESHSSVVHQPGAADYTIRIKVAPVEIAHNRIVSTTTYNGQFPGPLLRFKEGQPVTVDIYNDTDVAEQLGAPKRAPSAQRYFVRPIGVARQGCS